MAMDVPVFECEVEGCGAVFLSELALHGHQVAHSQYAANRGELR